MDEYAQAERAYAPAPRDAYPEPMDGRVSDVSAALLEADEGGQQLLEAIRELERRLSDVLRPEPDSAEKAMGVPRETMVPLAERLTSHNGTVRMARQYVVRILDRLEL